MNSKQVRSVALYLKGRICSVCMPIIGSKNFRTIFMYLENVTLLIIQLLEHFSNIQFVLLTISLPSSSSEIKKSIIFLFSVCGSKSSRRAYNAS